ncbi:hypothetical protein [Streptomyces antimycoticus]|nr:hypothetical protein [Streptomyces antimycoticus]
MTSPLSAFSVHHFHGAATRVPWEETAFALRKPPMMAEVIAMWTPETDGGRHAAWADAASAALEPHASPAATRTCWGLMPPTRSLTSSVATPARLLAVKDTVDPDGVFQGIPLPMSAPRAPEPQVT